VAETSAPNAEAIGVWNEILVPKFTRFRRVLADGFSVHSQRALEMHPVHRLEIGRADAARDGIAGAAFELADGQTVKFERPFDVCFARFGTMFFTNPAAAMTNLRRAIRPGGRLLMIVWRRIEDNAPFWTAKQIARKHLPPPADEAPSCGPGPFSMGDSQTTGAVLKAAQWSQVVFERVDADIWIGDTVDDALAFQLAIGPAGEIVRDAGALGEEKRPLIVDELRGTLARFQTPTGIFMPTSSWCVTARA
jgi:SAM-dependent methyltransferase